MGNCLEPSQSEIHMAKMDKIKKMAAREAALATMGVPPPPPQMMPNPYQVDPYNDPRLTGIYISTPPTQPQPQAYAMVDPRTGQGFIVHDTGPRGTSAVPVRIPLNEDTAFYHSQGQYSGRSFVTNHSVSSSKHKKHRRTDGNNNNDERDGGKEMRQAGENGVLVSVQEERLQTNSTSEVIATVDFHADDIQKPQQNGDVKAGIYTKSGVMDLEAETEPIIIDFLDPAPSTTKTKTTIEPEPLARKQPNVEYETVNTNTNTNSTILNGHSTKAYDIEPTVQPEAFVSAVYSSVHVNKTSPGIKEKSAVRFLGESVKGEQNGIINDELDSSFDCHAHSMVTEDIETFPPKNFNTETSSPLPDILKRTLSQTESSRLTSDLVDVVITYSVLGEYELDIVRRLTRQLELVGLSVWAERLGDSSRARKSDKTAQAILGAKVLIVMLSEGSCEQRFIRDHVAIATMTNISIFPVASEPPKQVKDSMPRELKVQLAPYSWTELVVENEDSFLFQLRSLARSVQDEVEERSNVVSNGNPPRGNLLQRQKSNQGMTANATNFWDVHFGHRDSVKWERLEHSLKDAFRMILNDTVPADLQITLFTAIKNRAARESSDVKRVDFIGMCHSIENKETDVWEAMVQIAGMLQAVRDVFDIESTVRNLAVEYTEHFANPSVVTSLHDLLSDPDPNFRAVSVVSLARCISGNMSDSQFIERIERTLQDEDQLVREAGCLALGHLRNQQAVHKLIHVWRNDVISQVREAAKLALDQIGGEEVEEAMRVTDVLANEIRELTDGTQID